VSEGVGSTIRASSLFLILVLAAAPAGTAGAGEATSARAVVVEAFLEIHTGPAVEYPVFYIAEKGETVVLIKRRTDWYKIRLSNGTEGWVHRSDIEKTLLSVGYKKGIMDRFYDRFLASSLELGWAVGTLGGDAAIRIRLAYHFSPAIGFETNAEFTSGGGENTSLYNGGLLLTVWDGRFGSVYATMGAGAVHVVPDSLIIGAKNQTFPEAHAGIGVRVPFYKTLAALFDFRNYTYFSDTVTTREFQEYTVGLSYGF
jgi:uncharacterized protein YraI